MEGCGVGLRGISGYIVNQDVDFPHRSYIKLYSLSRGSFPSEWQIYCHHVLLPLPAGSPVLKCQLSHHTDADPVAVTSQASHPSSQLLCIFFKCKNLCKSFLERRRRTRQRAHSLSPLSLPKLASGKHSPASLHLIVNSPPAVGPVTLRLLSSLYKKYLKACFQCLCGSTGSDATTPAATG